MRNWKFRIVERFQLNAMVSFNEELKDLVAESIVVYGFIVSFNEELKEIKMEM